jgi:hypothetical protein
VKNHAVEIHEAFAGTCNGSVCLKRQIAALAEATGSFASFGTVIFHNLLFFVTNEWIANLVSLESCDASGI